MNTNRNMNELLAGIGLEEGDTFVPDHDRIQAELARHDKAFSNIIIKVLSAIGGVLAASALLGFLLLAGIYESESGMMILGLLLVAAAIATSRVADHVFLDTVVLTGYISGFILAGIGLGMHEGNTADQVILLCLLLSLAGIFLSRGFMIVMISVVICSGSFYAYCSVHGEHTSFISLPVAITGIGLLVVTLKEARMVSGNRQVNRLYKPLQAGLFLSFLGGLIWVLHSYTFGLFPGFHDLKLISLLIDIMILVLVTRIMYMLGLNNKVHIAGIYVFVLVLLAAVFYAPGISGSLFLLLLAISYGYRAEAGMSIAALVYFIFMFYYSLRLSLLVKSGLLFFPGMIMILVWHYCYQQLKKNEKI